MTTASINASSMSNPSAYSPANKFAWLVKREFWEYRGKDSHGTYRVHIEFDKHDTVVIVGKIPDKVAGGKGTPAKS